MGKPGCTEPGKKQRAAHRFGDHQRGDQQKDKGKHQESPKFLAFPYVKHFSEKISNGFHQQMFLGEFCQDKIKRFVQTVFHEFA